MDTFIQDPDELRQYKIDWNTFLASQSTTAPTILSVTYIVPTASLTIASSSEASGISTSIINANTASISGTFICAHRVTLSDTQIVEWPFKIKIRSNNEG